MGKGLTGALNVNNLFDKVYPAGGGGFSPTAVLKLRRLARKVARGSVDRTAYSPKYSLFYVPPCRAHLSLCCARREPRHSLSPGNPVCTSRACVNRAPGPK